MDLPSPSDVVDLIDAFLARHDMAPSRFGRDALGEPQFVSSLKRGRMPGLDTLRKLSEFMQDKDEELVIAGEGTGGADRRHRLSAGAR